MRAAGHRGGGFHDGVGTGAVEQAEVPVDHRGRGLDQRQGAHEGVRHRPAGDAEIVAGALGLRTPQGAGGDLQRAHAVVLEAEAPRGGVGATGHGLLRWSIRRG